MPHIDITWSSWSSLITHLIDGLCLLHLHLAGRRVDAVRYLSLDRYQQLASESGKWKSDIQGIAKYFRLRRFDEWELREC